MPTSFRERLLAAFFDEVDGITNFQVRRRNFLNINALSDLPCLLMRDGGADIAGFSAEFNRIEQRVYLHIGVTAATEDGLGPALSAARADVLEALSASIASGINGLVSEVRYDGDEDPDFALEDGSPPLAELVMRFLLVGEEHATDPYQSA